MGKKIGLIIGILVALLAVGAGSFYGGTVYAGQQTSNARATFFNGRSGAGAGANGAGPNAAGGPSFGGGGVAGIIKSINGNTIQVSTAQDVTTVTLSSTTSVLKSVTASASDLLVGQQVTVRGQRDSSGNVAATTVQMVTAGAIFGGPGSGGNGGGAAATPAP